MRWLIWTLPARSETITTVARRRWSSLRVGDTAHLPCVTLVATAVAQRFVNEATQNLTHQFDQDALRLADEDSEDGRTARETLRDDILTNKTKHFVSDGLVCLAIATILRDRRAGRHAAA